MLDSKTLQLPLDLETSPLSLLRRMPNQVAWKHCLRVNHRLFSVFIILGGLDWRLRGWFQCARRYRGGWLICLGCAPDQDPLRQDTACAVPCVCSAATRDLTFPQGLTFGLLMCLWFELPTASGPKSARMYCGYRPGPTRVTLPSRQDDGNVRAPALRGLRGCAGGCCRTCAVVVVLPSQLYVCPHASSTDSLCRGCRATSQTQPVSLYVALHCCCCCCCCCVLEADVALSFGSVLRSDSSYPS